MSIAANNMIHPDNLSRECNDPLKIKQMWNMVVKNRRTDIINSGDVNENVYNSWLRSIKYGVSVSNVSEDRFLCRQKYIDHLDEYKHYLEFVKPFIYEFYESMGRSLYMINLYSKEGYHILRLGKEKALSYSDSLGIVKGLCFKEDVNGTCGFSLADILKKTVQIQGPEHYKEPFHEVIGCYSPIFNEKGVYIGVISVTNAKKTPNTHAVAMNFALSNAIGFLFRNHDILKSYEYIADNLRKYINNLPDSLVIVNSDGIIIDVNHKFIENIEAGNRDDVIGKHISTFTALGLIEAVDVVGNVTTLKGNSIEMILSTSTYYTDKERGFLILMKKTERIKNNIYTYFNKDNNTSMIGQDKNYIKCFELAYNCSKHNVPVLIEGESGTGKENLARYIHDQGIMKQGPFVSVNCSAIPKELFESIFFGYTEGAFTNARKGGNIGKIEMANGGTLFLDEIGDMPIDLQSKLLRVIEDKYIERIGMHGKIEINFRLIAATNKALQHEVENNNFRKDLYYRINTILIQLPPLRERRSDIEILANHYKELFMEKYKKHGIEIGRELMEFFTEYHWPGNIRELRNVLEYMVINNPLENMELTISGLPTYIKYVKNNAFAASIFQRTDEGDAANVPNDIRNLRCSEIDMIKHAISIYPNKSEAARRLGISRDKLYRKLREINGNATEEKRL